MVGYLGRRILPEVGVRARIGGEGLCVSYAGLHGIVKFTGVMEEVDRIRGFSHRARRWRYELVIFIHTLSLGFRLPLATSVLRNVPRPCSRVP